MASRPVLVVGAGPTGLTLGIELARRGVPFHLIERRPAPLGRDRAVALKARTLEVMASIGLADRFVQCGCVLRGVTLFSNELEVGSVDFDGLDTPFPYILSIPEEETERILTERLEHLGGRIERGIELTGLEQEEWGVRARLRALDDRERTVEASWVVGTDGLHSLVRETIGDTFEGHDYPALWGVADAHLVNWRRPSDRVTVQSEPPVAIAFPLRDGRWRFTFRLASDEEDALATIRSRLEAISPGATLRDPDEPQLFRTHARVARRYRAGRSLIAGDAAHVSTPFEGHGMNTGIQDAYNLGWKLALVVQGMAPVTLLDSYEAERRPIAEAIARSGDDAEARARPQDAEARRGLRAFLATPEGRRAGAIAEMEIAFGYDRSPIVEEMVAGPAAGGTPIGFRVGDAAPVEQRGRARRLHELIATPEHTLFMMLGEADAAALDRGLALAAAAGERYGPHLRAYVVTRNATPGGEILCDPTGALHTRFGADRPTLCVVRPDGHLGLRVAPPSVDRLEIYFRRILRPR